jgi:leucyl aminopeptidase (aminopeptidase T)
MPGLSREIRSLAKPGSIVFLMEMKDSQSGAVLARAADSAAAPTIAADSSVQTDWQSVQQAAQRWAKLFRQFLDANLAR